MFLKSRHIALIAALAFFAGCASKTVGPLATAPDGIDWASAKTISVALSDFAFKPDHPSFPSGQPVRLMLDNVGSGKHDFSAPKFFAASAFRAGTTLPVNGSVLLSQGEKAEIDFVPGAPGEYALECTEFLHTLFGMTGGVTVTKLGS